MNAIKIRTTKNRVIISIEKKQLENVVIQKAIEKIRLEKLAGEVDFDERIEELGKQIKAGWWENNIHNFENLDEP